MDQNISNSQESTISEVHSKVYYNPSSTYSVTKTIEEDPSYFNEDPADM